MKKLIGIVFLFGGFSALAQTELPTGKIEVVKDFEVRLIETKKMRIVPQPIPLDSNIRKYEYKLLAASPSIEYLAPEIKPLAIKSEKQPPYYPFFAKAGYGSPNSILGALSFDHVQNEVFHWGVDLDHLSANNKEIPLQKFSTTGGRINAGYLLNESIQLDGYLDGHFQKNYFYGTDPIPSNPESLKRNFKRYDTTVKMSKVHSEGTSFRYNASFQYLFDQDDLGSRESTLRLGGEIGSALGNQGYPLGLKLMADLTDFNHTEQYANNQILIEPYFTYFIGDLKADLGGLFVLSKGQNEVLPEIELAYSLSDPQLILHAGWTGAVTKNGFHSLSNLNPYISTRLEGIPTQTVRRIYAGITGATGTMTYDLTGSHNSFETMAFFLQDEDEPEQFIPVYDDGTYIGIEGSLQIEILKHVIVHTRIFQRFYSLDHEEKPWHMPSFGMDGQISYAGGKDTYHVSLLFHGENGLPYRSVGGTEDNLDPLIDLSLHGDYFITNTIGAFLEVNNIFGNNRERWVNYPSFGFNAKAGVLFRLP